MRRLCDELTYGNALRMDFHVKTTLNISEPVMKRLKSESVRQGVTMSELVERALRLLLQANRAPRAKLPPLPVWNSGGALVNVANRDALYDVIDRN